MEGPSKTQVHASASNEIAGNCNAWSPSPTWWWRWLSRVYIARWWFQIFPSTRTSVDTCMCSDVGVCIQNLNQNQHRQCSTYFFVLLTFSLSSNRPSFESDRLRRTGAVLKWRRGSWRKANFRTSKHGSMRALWPHWVGLVWRPVWCEPAWAEIQGNIVKCL